MGLILKTFLIALFTVAINAKIHKFVSASCEFSGTSFQVDFCAISPNGTLELIFNIRNTLTEVFVKKLLTKISNILVII